jgi:hypothetical protein
MYGTGFYIRYILGAQVFHFMSLLLHPPSQSWLTVTAELTKNSIFFLLGPDIFIVRKIRVRANFSKAKDYYVHADHKIMKNGKISEIYNMRSMLVKQYAFGAEQIQTRSRSRNWWIKSPDPYFLSMKKCNRKKSVWLKNSKIYNFFKFSFFYLLKSKEKRFFLFF